jgi:hypothetical protein
VTGNLQDDAAAEVQAFDETVDVRVSLLDVQVQHTNTALFQRPERLVVTVGVPPGESVAGLGQAIDERADDTAGRDIAVEVRYVATETE